MQQSKMKVGKDRERKRKKRAIPKESVAVPLEPFDNRYRIAGVTKIVLSTMTQRAIGCVVGEDLTTDDPWILIKKEKIEDNLEFHEESSDFLPIKQCIVEYPEEEMLIGFDKPIEEDKLEFFFCTTKNAKEEVMGIIEKNKIEMQERLKQSIMKRPRRWKSHGSEAEVDEIMIKNFRPLLEIEINSIYPLSTEKKKFKLRLVEDSVDGYVELLPGRFPTTNIYRKRIDASVQVTPQTTDNEMQTNPTYPKHKWTQYEYDYIEPKLNKDQNKNLVEFVTQQAEHLSETIHVNEHINLYTDDYTKNSKYVAKGEVVTNRDIFSFRHVIACKSKVVTDVTLDPFYSGILAASYGKWSFNHFITENMLNEDYDPVNECTFGNHLVLIWCNTNSLKPKLYLHSNREVNKVRHCASRPDILVGGCKNGQIILWDMIGRLKNVETLEILTPTEQKHRSIIQSYMSWMKSNPDSSIVLPTVISNPETSHKNVVTEIRFLATEYRITKNGKVEKCQEGEESLQFMTSSLDGTILIWDLLDKSQIGETSRPKKTSRLGKRPSALLSNISEFRYLHLKMNPIYKINVLDKVTQMPFPISTINVRNENFFYEARNPETLSDYSQRTYFDRVKSTKTFQFDTSIQITDMLGHLMNTKFEGHDYDLGERINFENAQYTDYQLVHDGPIRCCLTNMYVPDLVLTVGGRIFAIWHLTALKKPLFYRKIHCRYVGGVWSTQQIGAVVLQREDTYIETWTMLYKTNGPDRVVRMSGNATKDYFSDYRRRHVKKMTICSTDIFGAVRIYKVPPPSQKFFDEKSQVQLGKFMCGRIMTRKGIQKKWLEDWKSKHQPTITEPEQQPTQEIPPKEEQSTGTTTELLEQIQETEASKDELKKKKKKPLRNPKILMQEKQLKMMYDTLLEKNRLNLDEIEKHKIPLQELIQAEKLKIIKQKETLARKDEIFYDAKKNIFKDTVVKKKEKFRIILSEDSRREIKQEYKHQFDSLLENTLNFIMEHEYRYVFTWDRMMSQGKERRVSMNAAPPIQSRKGRFSNVNRPAGGSAGVTFTVDP